MNGFRAAKGLALSQAPESQESLIIPHTCVNRSTIAYRFGPSPEYDAAMSLDHLKSRVSTILGHTHSNVTKKTLPSVLQDTSPVQLKPKRARRKWTDQDYAMRGIRRRGPLKDLHCQVNVDALELAVSLAADQKMSLGAWVERAILAEAERAS